MEKSKNIINKYHNQEFVYNDHKLELFSGKIAKYYRNNQFMWDLSFDKKMPFCLIELYCKNYVEIQNNEESKFNLDYTNCLKNLNHKIIADFLYESSL